MIQFDQVCKTYSQRDLFKNLSFCINQNDKCGFVGRNGSGKTTLFRLITKKESLDSGFIKTPKDYTFGYLDQHIKFSKNSIIEESIKNLDCEEWEKEYKAETILFGLGFKKEDMTKNPNELSGGYQLRLHLTKVLLSEPSCLLLDEPTNYLDIISIHWLKKFLKSWRGAFVIISHDRDFLDSVTTHTIGLHRAKMYKVKGGTKNLFELILKKELVYESNRLNIEKKRAHMEGFIKRFGAKASKASQAKSKKKSLEKISPLEQLVKMNSLQFFFNEAPFPGKKILTTENVSFSYKNMPCSKQGKELIENLSFSIEKGERVAIIGKNGYGKSTILKLLFQDLFPKSGSISISDNASIGYFGQTNIDRLDLLNTIIDEIVESNPSLNIGEVRRICGIMMFAKDDAKKKISLLSGGEKSRVLLGKILAKPCNILLLDEPTNHLDMESVESLLEALESFSGAIIIVTHNEMILNRLSLDKLIVCHQQKQSLFLGNYEEFLEKKGWEEDSGSCRQKKQLKGLESKENKKNNSNALKKDMTIIERNIIALEKELLKAEKTLLDASQNNKKVEIIKFSKIVSDRRNEIDKLFFELEQLSSEYYKNY